MLCSGSIAPLKRPSCRSCWPLSRMVPSVQRVTAEAGLAEETMRAVTIRWRTGIVGLADKEIVGVDVVRETVRSALPEIGFLYAEGQ